MKSNSQLQYIQQNRFRGVAAVAFAAALVLPSLAFAQDAAAAQGSVTKFFTSLNSLLNIASIAVVTIAIIFAGYQIAFAHKRISDVAPVLIGGFLIGAAAQLAKMLLGDSVGQVGTAGGMALLQSIGQLTGLYA